MTEHDGKVLHWPERAKGPTCLHDGRALTRAIYMGFPLTICERCHEVAGIGARVIEWFPVATDSDEFAFFVYRGSYWRALFAWLRGEEGTR
jgi:hypothetical protein